MVERYSAFAGVIINDQGETEIVIAGGQNNLIEMDEVEIFSFATMSWRQTSNPLQHPIANGYSVPYGNTFLMVGGRQLSSR